MNRKITDLLDTYDDPVLELNMETPLSKERIKVLTLDRIQEKKRNRKPIFFRTLAAAAIILTLSLTVFALGNATGWFQDFFAKRNDGELSDGQIEFIDSNSASANQSQTVDGYTVTMDSYLTDGSAAYLKFVIQAPDGQAIPPQGYSFREMHTYLPDGMPACGFIYWDLEQQDSAASTVTYLCTLDYLELAENPGDVIKVIVELSDLYAGAKPVKGTWQFEIEITDTSLELLTAPVSGVTAKNESGTVIDVTVTSVRLRPMGLRILYYATDVNETYGYYPGVAKAALLDGTEVELIPGGFGRVSDEPGTELWAEYATGILPVEEIDHIELPGGVQIPVNGQ